MPNMRRNRVLRIAYGGYSELYVRTLCRLRNRTRASLHIHGELHSLKQRRQVRQIPCSLRQNLQGTLRGSSSYMNRSFILYCYAAGRCPRVKERPRFVRSKLELVQEEIATMNSQMRRTEGRLESETPIIYTGRYRLVPDLISERNEVPLTDFDFMKTIAIRQSSQSHQKSKDNGRYINDGRHDRALIVPCMSCNCPSTS